MAKNGRLGDRLTEILCTAVFAFVFFSAISQEWSAVVAQNTPSSSIPQQTAQFETAQNKNTQTEKLQTEILQSENRQPVNRSPQPDENADLFQPTFPDRLPYCERFGMVVCESDFPLSDIAAFQTEIMDLQTDLIDYLGIPKPNEKIGLCVFAERSSYIRFLREVYPQAPTDRPALYIKDRGPGILFLQADDRLILNLRHEMTHAILNASLRFVPIWIDEGLAKYFETPRGNRALESPFLDPVADRASSFFTPIPSLPNLEKLSRIDQMGPTQYRDAWAWTHFLIHYSPQTHQLLGHYLQTLRPENRQSLTTRQAAKIQQSAPLTTMLKHELPDYKRCYKDHFEQWQKRTQ